MFANLYCPILLVPLFSLTVLALHETKGYGCHIKQSLKLDKSLHGFPKKTEPPFEFHFIDAFGTHVKSYMPGQIYTIRLIGYERYRGFVIQSRASNGIGSMIGSLSEGRFVEDSLWSPLGIRFQGCSKSYPTLDSITHSNDKQKYITQAKWTTDKNVGPIQFIFTIAINDKVYWEKWTPKSGFILSNNA
uniref:Reelin domain-containing protein n=1 Tax=Rhabditophanes sp. KR3021 TaxID=114890 RepID=A0AC35TL17_9BILA